MMKRAYVVLGPESSGTRLVGKILAGLGCEGDILMRQWNLWLPMEEKLAMIRWSFPHAKKWPDIEETNRELGQRGYQVRHVIMTRDYRAMAQSQVEHRHVKTMEQAKHNIIEGYRRIFSSALQKPTIVNYDSLVKRPRSFIAWLADELKLSGKVDMHITDETRKYYTRR